MEHIKYLKCIQCGREHTVDETLYTCLDCGIDGALDVVYDMTVVAQRFLKHQWHNRQTASPSIWRYLDLLPIQGTEFVPNLKIGWTPLYDCYEFAERYNRQHDVRFPKHLYIKDDGRSPTASFKDRASAMAVVKAKELGKEVITCASTGNAASSLAGLAASMGISTYIFVPETAPKAKVAQLLMYGANVMMVKGSYDQAYDLCLQASDEWGWYSRNSGYNPYLGEGKKTAALELCEQLGWQAPDKVFVSVGDGCIIGGMWKGFCDLYELGLIERLPQMIGVQAEGASPLVTAFKSGQPLRPLEHTTTLADSIAVGYPRDAAKALRAARDSKGHMMSVSDEQILAAMKTLARNTGVFAEPAGATAFAGLQKLAEQRLVDHDERVAVIVTGNGLKDIDTAISAAGTPSLVDPDFASVQQAVAALS
ncbi:threonine synthase [candidate division KSB3 bacterium]|uniref:Threonine synthase n=1 Tax=candidate division KSB3 bacterium TaxID=2044937 RepID=A0A2G6KGS8_9BACT|nr:MAG: threonine synthase [candidate division KSB3 bacterium]